MRIIMFYYFNIKQNMKIKRFMINECKLNDLLHNLICKWSCMPSFSCFLQLHNYNFVFEWAIDKIVKCTSQLLAARSRTTYFCNNLTSKNFTPDNRYDYLERICDFKKFNNGKLVTIYEKLDIINVFCMVYVYDDW